MLDATNNKDRETSFCAIWVACTPAMFSLDSFFGQVDPLQWVLSPDSAEHVEHLRSRAASPEAHSHVFGLASALWIACCLLYIRSHFNTCLKLLTRRRKASLLWSPKVFEKVEEEIWVTMGGTVLLVWSWYCVYDQAEGCGISRTTGCVQGWPLQAISTSTSIYYNVELGWYLQLLWKHAVGLGLKDSTTMLLHHWSTVGLLVASYLLGFHRLGVLVLAVFNVSNPLLHASKLANILEMKTAKVVLFAAFGMAFALTRVVMLPLTVMKCALLETHALIPDLLKYLGVYYILVNTLLIILYVMQLVWMGAIYRVLSAALSKNDVKVATIAAAEDPTGVAAKNDLGERSE